MQSKVLKFGSIKLGKIRSGVSDYNSKSETATPEQTHTSFGKRSGEGSIASVGLVGEANERVYSGKQSESRPDTYSESNDDYGQTIVSHSMPKDAKPLLRFKFKKPNMDNQNLQEEEKSSIKGQRSKRKRPSPFVEKSSIDGADVTQAQQDNLMDEIMDANWILKKLGKDAIGKLVEVHQPSDNSW